MLAVQPPEVDPAFVDAMAAIKPLVSLGLLAGLKRELPAYLAAARLPRGCQPRTHV